MIKEQVCLYQGDIDDALYDLATASGLVAWDIETSGLDWASDRIGTCQLATAGAVAIVQLGAWGAPDRLSALLEDVGTRKVFHHAPFDLRFMTFQWKVQPRNVACTKIAAKVLEPGGESSSYSLKPLLARHLDVHIEKDQQLSDWMLPSLSEEQLRYAAKDVEHLIPLYEALLERASATGSRALIDASYEYLPVRVRLDIAGAGDVFAY